MKLLIMQFSPAPYYYISSRLGQNILLSTLFTYTLSLCSSLNVRETFTPIQNYRESYRSVYLYFKFLDSRQKDKF
jgi:hypothetical protein